MKKYVSYKEKFNRNHDFLVRYELIEPQENYSAKVYQGVRCDFCYEEDYGKGQIYMIWPEFEDESGNVIMDSSIEISSKGKARMWIMLEESRSQHKQRLKVGGKGYLVHGSHKLANVEVIEIVSLKDL